MNPCFFNILECQTGAKRQEARILELQEVITVDDAIRRGLSLADLRKLIAQTLDVYTCYYKNGLLHNDLKVQNVFLHGDRVVFGDFDRTILIKNRINPYNDAELTAAEMLDRMRRDFSRFAQTFNQSISESGKYVEAAQMSEAFGLLLAVLRNLSITHQKMELDTAEAIFEYVAKYIGKIKGGRRTRRRGRGRGRKHATYRHRKLIR